MFVTLLMFFLGIVVVMVVLHKRRLIRNGELARQDFDLIDRFMIVLMAAFLTAAFIFGASQHGMFHTTTEYWIIAGAVIGAIDVVLLAALRPIRRSP